MAWGCDNGELLFAASVPQLLRWYLQSRRGRKHPCNLLKPWLPLDPWHRKNGSLPDGRGPLKTTGVDAAEEGLRAVRGQSCQQSHSSYSRWCLQALFHLGPRLWSCWFKVWVCWVRPVRNPNSLLFLPATSLAWCHLHPLAQPPPVPGILTCRHGPQKLRGPLHSVVFKLLHTWAFKGRFMVL